MKYRKTRYSLSALALAVAVCPRYAGAVIFVSTGDPNFNTTAPTGTLANSGWQWQGDWNTGGGNFTATPIGTHYFVAAAHTGVSDRMTLNGVDYFKADIPGPSPQQQWI